MECTNAYGISSNPPLQCGDALSAASADAGTAPPAEEKLSRHVVPPFCGLLCNIFREVDQNQRDAKAIRKKAEELRSSAGASGVHIERHPEKNLYAVILSWPPRENGAVDYAVHHVRIESGKAVSGPGACISEDRSIYEKALIRMIARQRGKPTTFMNGSGEKAEIIDGPFDPHADIQSMSFSTVSLVPPERGDFAVAIVPVPPETTSHARTREEVDQAVSFFRAEFPRLMALLAPHSSPLASSLFEQASRETARLFQAHLISAEEMEGIPAQALGGKYVDVVSGLDQSSTRSKMLHELIHLTYDNIDGEILPPSDNASAHLWIKRLLNEGLTEYLTRRVIGLAKGTIDFEACPCGYYGSDVLYVLVQAGVLAERDLLEAYALGDAIALKQKIDDRFHVPLIDELFYRDQKEDPAWFRRALGLLERIGIGRERTESILKEGMGAGRVSAKVFDALSAAESRPCNAGQPPDLYHLF